jgi:flagellar biosynthesis GTPase FlhF
VTIIVNNSEEKIQIYHKAEFNYKYEKRFVDKEGLIINSVGTFNTTLSKHCY